jgi:DnaK suppressor protein
VRAALARFQQGTYGLCERCGMAIDPARLQALPYAALCMACQQHLEQA